MTQGMLSTATGSSGVKIFGVDAEEEIEVSRLDKKLFEGDLLNAERGMALSSARSWPSE